MRCSSITADQAVVARALALADKAVTALQAGEVAAAERGSLVAVAATEGPGSSSFRLGVTKLFHVEQQSTSVGDLDEDERESDDHDQEGESLRCQQPLPIAGAGVLRC